MNKLIAIIFCCRYPTGIWACSCIGKNTVKQEIIKSDVVFSGVILSRNIFSVNDDNLPTGLTLKKAEYIVLINKIYKGQLKNDTLKVITGVGGGDCGFEFSVGAEYIIYSLYSNKYFERGGKVDKFLYTDICTRTRYYNKREAGRIRRCFSFLRIVNGAKCSVNSRQYFLKRDNNFGNYEV